MFTTQRLYNYGAKYISVQTCSVISLCSSTLSAQWFQWLASGALSAVLGCASLSSGSQGSLSSQPSSDQFLSNIIPLQVVNQSSLIIILCTWWLSTVIQFRLIAVRIEKFSFIGLFIVKMCFMGPVEISRILWRANLLDTGNDVTVKFCPYI